jgi:fimbrial chaperone protein
VSVTRYERTFVVAVRALLAGLALCQAGSAHAATFSVNPTQVFLSGKVTSGLVSLRNESDETLRFQLSVVAWAQAPDGQMKFAPTQDIVFYPQLLTLGPREERKIRVGTTLAPAAIEKTYRLFVEELPPSQAEQTPGTVRVLTKMGIPIFLRASDSPPQAELRDLSVVNGRLTFTIANKGATHFVPEKVTIRAIGPGGEPAGEEAFNAWYVLAGTTRLVEVDLPKTAISAVVVEMRVSGAGNALTARLDLPRHP